MPYWQTSRQQHFPLALTDIGISFDCMKGQASIPRDEQRIKHAIKGGRKFCCRKFCFITEKKNLTKPVKHR